MGPIPYLDADAIRAGVPIADMLDAVETAYRDVAAGRDRSPIRSRVELPNGDLLLMPGVRVDSAGASVKLVTVTPANTERGLPTIQALVVWLDTETGRPLALIDGATLTAMRTGAASGVATRLLARLDVSTVALIGAGAQAEWQLRAVLAARPIRRALVFSREERARREFAERMAEHTGIAIEAADTAEAAVRESDVICCATTSTEPVFEASWVAPGTHVNGVGAYRLGMVEIPAELFGLASVVAIDSRAAAMEEAGDVVAAIERGLVAEDGLVEIGSIDPDWAATRPADAITVFKSVGLAIQDVAAAELITDRLLGQRDWPSVEQALDVELQERTDREPADADRDDRPD